MLLRNKSGFSLVEVLLSIVIIGILSALSYPCMTNIIEKCRSELAISFAQSVNAAKSSFWMKNANGEEEYARQTANKGRYDLIKEYMSNSNVSLERALPQGYQIIMNDSIRDRVELFNNKGEIVY